MNSEQKPSADNGQLVSVNMTSTASVPIEFDQRLIHGGEVLGMDRCDSYEQKIVHLLDSLSAIQRSYKELLEISIREKQLHIDELMSRREATSNDLPNGGTVPRSSSRSHGQEVSYREIYMRDRIGRNWHDDESVRSWLSKIGVDEETIAILERQNYTKLDLIGEQRE